MAISSRFPGSILIVKLLGSLLLGAGILAPDAHADTHYNAWKAELGIETIFAQFETDHGPISAFLLTTENNSVNCSYDRTGKYGGSEARIAVSIPFSQTINPDIANEMNTNSIVYSVNAYCAAKTGQPFQAAEIEAEFFSLDVDPRNGGVPAFTGWLKSSTGQTWKTSRVNPLMVAAMGNLELYQQAQQSTIAGGFFNNYYRTLHEGNVRSAFDICEHTFQNAPSSFTYEGTDVPFRQPGEICLLAKNLRPVLEDAAKCVPQRGCDFNHPETIKFIDTVVRPALGLVAANLVEYLRIFSDTDYDNEDLYQSFASTFLDYDSEANFLTRGIIYSDQELRAGLSPQKQLKHYIMTADMMVSQAYIDHRIAFYRAKGIIPADRRWPRSLKQKDLVRHQRKIDNYRASMEARSSYRTISVPNCSQEAYSSSIECRVIQSLQGYHDDYILHDIFRESINDFNVYVPNYQNGTLRYSTNRNLSTQGRYSDLKTRQNTQYAAAARRKKEEDAIAPLAAAILGGMAAYVFLGKPDPSSPPAWTPDTKMHTFGYSANDLIIGSPSTF